jgi:hypothetical protein
MCVVMVQEIEKKRNKRARVERTRYKIPRGGYGRRNLPSFINVTHYEIVFLPVFCTYL